MKADGQMCRVSIPAGNGQLGCVFALAAYDAVISKHLTDTPIEYQAAYITQLRKTGKVVHKASRYSHKRPIYRVYDLVK